MAGLYLTGAATAQAEAPGPAAELSPDRRPVLLLQPPQGPLLLVRHAVLLPNHRGPLPAAWRTSEPDRGFTAALLMQLSHVAAKLAVAHADPHDLGPRERQPAADSGR